MMTRRRVLRTTCPHGTLARPAGRFLRRLQLGCRVQRTREAAGVRRESSGYPGLMRGGSALEQSWGRPRRRSPVAVVVAGAAVLAVGAAAVVVAARRDEASTGEPSSTSTAAVAAGPRVHVPASVAPSVPGFVNSVRGLVDGADTLLADGAPVTIEPGGAFTVLIPQGTSQVQLTASTAGAGSTMATVAVTDQHAVPAYPVTAALHVRGEEWADPALRQQVLDLARTGRINAVELDIKDEAGLIDHASTVPLATTIGAVAAQYDAATAVAEIHAAGARVIGRIVCFLDPVLAGWAWANARPELLVLNAGGSAPLTNGYGSAAFTNPAHAEVRQYQIDL